MTEDQRNLAVFTSATTIYVALRTLYPASPPKDQIDRAVGIAFDLILAVEAGDKIPVQDAAPATAPTPSPGIPQPPRRVSIAEAIAAGPAPLPEQPVIVVPTAGLPAQDEEQGHSHAA